MNSDLKKAIIISISALALCWQAEAQLLEDTQRRLKTSKTKTPLFAPKKGKSTSGAHKQRQKTSTPRFSEGGISVRSKGVSPRFSAPNPFRGFRYKVVTRNSTGNPFRGTKYRTVTRNSAGSPFKGKTYRVAPRYSPGNPLSGFRYVVSPRYSRGNPFRGSQYRVTPRYSLGMPFGTKDYRVAPRYSSGNPFRGYRYKVAPRYSSGNPFTGYRYKVTPRYSRGNPFRGNQYRVAPRYSQGMPFTRKDFTVNPRYSAGNPFRGVKWIVKPRYSESKHRFDVLPNRIKKQIRIYTESSTYKGDYKIARRGPGDQHPSSNYHFAMRFTSPKVRKALRQWNVFWVRVNGNKEESKGVRASVRGPKFDKKEKDIWNN